MGEASVGSALGCVGTSVGEGNLCLVCGHHGRKTVIVTSGHSFVKSSGTALSKFLFNVVGEEPCYAMSEVVCEQCYNLLDRLDSYQALATQMQSHITTRYKDTKLELLGQRQRLSDLISSSLSNMKEMESGTKLNVSSELTITVVHEEMPQKSLDLPTKNLFKSAETILKERNFNQKKQKSNSKRKTLYDSVSKVSKKKNKSSKKSLDKSNAKNKLNLTHSTLIKNLSTLVKLNVQPNLNMSSDLNCFNTAQDMYTNTSTIIEVPSLTNKQNLNDENNKRIQNNLYFTKKSKPLGNLELSHSSPKAERLSTIHHKSLPYSIEENQTVESDKDALSANIIPKIEIENDDTSELDIDQSLMYPIQNKDVDGESSDTNSQLVEEALMQNPLASSLLQSFLSTSLWFGSPECDLRKCEGVAKNLDPEIEDVTRESLVMAAGASKDKKRRQELKNTGQSYVNTKGKLVEAKRVQPQDCSRCPLRCNSRISEEERLSIFAEFWGLADYNLQREYLAVHMHREEKLGPSGLTRTVVLYYITHSNKKIQVCRQFFLKTLDVSEKASRIVLEKKLKGELGNDKNVFLNQQLPENENDTDQNDENT